MGSYLNIDDIQRNDKAYTELLHIIIDVAQHQCDMSKYDIQAVKDSCGDIKKYALSRNGMCMLLSTTTAMLEESKFPDYRCNDCLVTNTVRDEYVKNHCTSPDEYPDTCIVAKTTFNGILDDWLIFLNCDLADTLIKMIMMHKNKIYVKREG